MINYLLYKRNNFSKKTIKIMLGLLMPHVEFGTEDHIIKEKILFPKLSYMSFFFFCYFLK